MVQALFVVMLLASLSASALSIATRTQRFRQRYGLGRALRLTAAAQLGVGALWIVAGAVYATNVRNATGPGLILAAFGALLCLQGARRLAAARTR